MSLEQLYQQVILDHARQRHGNTVPISGLPEVPRPSYFGHSHQVNPTCGDEITVEVERREEDGRIVLRWDGQGCSISMASASVLSELAQEAKPDEVAPVMAGFQALMHSRGQGEPDEELLGDAAAFHGVSRYPARIKCALLAWKAFEDALRQANADYPDENGDRSTGAARNEED